MRRSMSLVFLAIAATLAASGTARAGAYALDVTTASGAVMVLAVTTGAEDTVLTPGYDITAVTGTVGGVSISDFNGLWGNNGDIVSDGLYLHPYLNMNTPSIDGNGVNVFTVQNPPGSGGANVEIDNIYYTSTAAPNASNSHLSYQGGIALLLANGATYYLSANTAGLTGSGAGLGDGQYYDWLGSPSPFPQPIALSHSEAIPEASTWLMLALGFAGLGLAGGRKGVLG